MNMAPGLDELPRKLMALQRFAEDLWIPMRPRRNWDWKVLEAIYGMKGETVRISASASDGADAEWSVLSGP